MIKVKQPEFTELTNLTERDRQILATATKIFAKRGYRNTDVQEIADSLGIGKATIYRAFGTKEQLFFATVDYGMQTLSSRMCQLSENNPDPIGSLEQAIFTFLSYFDANPELIELLMQERSEFRDSASNSFLRHWLANAPHRMSKMKACVDSGKFRNIAPEQLLDVMSGLCYGAIFINNFLKKRMNLEVMAKVMTDVVLFGVLTDNERSHRKHKEIK